jgi:hypothetical protein
LGLTAIETSVGPVPAVNVAVTVSAAAGIAKVHVSPAAVHAVGAPTHPVNVDPFVPASVNVTAVPEARFTVQFAVDPLTQLIPFPVTVPVPVPAVITVSANVAALTVIVPEVPAIDAVAVSVVVIVCAPTVCNTAGNVPTPFSSAEFDGSTAVPSLLVKCTVPVYPVAVVFEAVSAVTVMLNIDPAVAFAGAVTLKCVAAFEALTVIVPDEPVIEAVTVSVAATVCAPAVFRVTENVPTPFVNVEFAGSTAAPSLLVKCTVPA